MDTLLRELERQLTGPAGDYVRQLIAGGAQGLTPEQLAYFLTLLLYETKNADVIVRFLVAAARAGLLDGEAVMAAIARATQLLAEAEAAAAAAAEAAAAEAAAAGAAAGEGAAAAGTGLLLAKLAALLAVAYALYAIIAEVAKTVPDVGVSGKPCGVGTPDGEYMRRMYRTVQVWGIGQKTALERALRRAEAAAQADAHRCKGACPGGGTCQPTVAVDRVDIAPSLLGTYVTVGFTTLCVCA